MKLLCSSLVLTALFESTVLATLQNRDDNASSTSSDASAVEPVKPDFNGPLQDTWSADEWTIKLSEMFQGQQFDVDVIFQANATCENQVVSGYTWINGSTPEKDVTVGQIKDDIDSHSEEEWKQSELIQLEKLYKTGQNLTESKQDQSVVQVARRLRKRQHVTGRYTITLVGMATAGIFYSIFQGVQSSRPVGPGGELGEPTDNAQALGSMASLVTTLAYALIMSANAGTGNFARADRFLYSLLRSVIIVAILTIAGQQQADGHWLAPPGMHPMMGVGDLAGVLRNQILERLGFRRRRNLASLITQNLICRV